jgi:hypothetical protein
VGSDLVGGRLTIRDGGKAAATSGVVVGGLGEIHGNGFVGAAVQNGGLVSPGMSVGSLRFQSDYIQTANGELLIELASATSFDQLLIGNDVTLNGTLTVNLLDGFIPSSGQAFTILTAHNVNGTFGTEVLPTIPNLAFDVIYNDQSIVITVMSALAGDYNGNGVVDAADYVAWRKNDGGPIAYNTWRTHFGQTAGSGAGATGIASAAVPEPSTRLTLILGMLAIFFRRRAWSLNL